MSLKTTIQNINSAGQTIWCDNLSKKLVQSGELQELINNGVSGVTSNPAIFKKSIADTNDYDLDIKSLVTKSSNLTADEITEMLMIEDVRSAAKLFEGIYNSTNKTDGYVSIEVSPDLAHDTAGTIEAAKRIWSKFETAKIPSPNIMIKIPATKEGILAIKTAIEEGINVNVTLIFSTDVYRKVINAYFEGLEARVSKGLPISQIASVASFFVSRVDTIVDKQLEKLTDKQSAKELISQIGILNSVEAYKLFNTEFMDDATAKRFKALKQKGAQIQKALWASTGVKNPNLDPLYYVKALAGENTVNTVPPQVLTALNSEGVEINTINIKQDNTAIFEELKELGVNLDEMLVQLEVEGVKLFVDAYKDLIEAVNKKMK